MARVAECQQGLHVLCGRHHWLWNIRYAKLIYRESKLTPRTGMCTAIDLVKQGIQNFVILEKSGGVGGTWRDQKYPGCCCDVWSLLYSFSFEQNPDWTREYPGQEEILEYLIRTAAKYNLYRYIRFNTEVTEAKWDDSEKQWVLDCEVSGGSKDSEFGDGKYTMTSDFVVSAVGQLNQPKLPTFDGMDEFKGKTMHSARWDWTFDLTGKRVAIVGNGEHEHNGTCLD